MLGAIPLVILASENTGLGKALGRPQGREAGP